MTFETDYMTISASSSDASALTLNADKILRQIKVQVTRVELLKGRTPDEKNKDAVHNGATGIYLSTHP